MTSTAAKVSVALSDTRIVVGANLNDRGAPDAGSAYVYDLGGTTPGEPLAVLANPDPGFVLQYTDRLAPAGWVNAPSGAQNPLTVSTTNTARFYRLAQP